MSHKTKACSFYCSFLLFNSEPCPLNCWLYAYQLILDKSGGSIIVVHAIGTVDVVNVSVLQVIIYPFWYLRDSIKCQVIFYRQFLLL